MRVHLANTNAAQHVNKHLLGGGVRGTLLDRKQVPRFLLIPNFHAERQSVTDGGKLLANMYAAFNARNIDSVLDAMCDNFDWPNGWEGGRI
jgi:hypothetical protein